MYYSIKIQDKDGISKNYGLNFTQYSPSKHIIVEDVCIINIYKWHDHRYDIKCFFYKKKYIYCEKCIPSKKELYNRIQNLLQQNL